MTMRIVLHHYIVRSALLFLPILLASCLGDNEDAGEPKITIRQIGITLAGVDSINGTFEVQLRNTQTGSAFKQSADTTGRVLFNVCPGIYEATSSKVLQNGTNSIQIFNGVSGQIVVADEALTEVVMKMSCSTISQLVIKELYNGGVMKDDGKAFLSDKCFIIYNNSQFDASFGNLCVAFCAPYNSQANNRWYGNDGKLVYEAEGYIPAIDGIWYFPDTLRLAPYTQVVVNCHGAIDNTLTYPNSVNYAHAEYYCMYDPEAGYVNASYYPTPASVIPTSHYLKAVKLGVANAWALSATSPAFFLFQVQGTTPCDYATNVVNMDYVPNSAQTDVNKVLKVPVEWIVDGIEVFAAGYKNSNLKRLTATVDAGYIELTNQHGHSLYRNVDLEATKQLPENEGKLVYGYGLGADPSGIDAEASLKNGAHIIYMDTNNSSADFHERQYCSLRTME